MQDSEEWLVPCGDVGLPVHVRAHAGEHEAAVSGRRRVMQGSAEWSVPCGNVGLPVHVRAHRPDWRRVRSAGRSGLKQAGPGRL